MSEHDDFLRLMQEGLGDTAEDLDAALAANDGTTFGEDLQAMRERLISMGAGERALVGTVVNTEHDSTFKAVYGVTENPPAVVEIAMSGNGLYSVTRVAVSEQDEPQVDYMRQGINQLDDPQLLFDMHTQVDGGEMRRLGEQSGQMTFDRVFYNVEGFTPEN